MQKFENVDLIDTLRQIMQAHTQYYKQDFKYDIDAIQKAAMSGSKLSSQQASAAIATDSTMPGNSLMIFIEPLLIFTFVLDYTSKV